MCVCSLCRETLSVGEALNRLMRTTRRRRRTADPLASPATVERDIDRLCVSLIDLIPRPHKNLSTLLNSVRGFYTR